MFGYKNGTAQTSNTLTVQVNGLPSSSFTVGNAQSSGVPLTSTSSSGSGSISTYRWYRDGASISGATSSTYSATQDGSYSLVVTNSNGCSQNSSAQYVTVPVTTCILSTPSGLASASFSPTSQLVTWSSMPQTDSVIVRYKKKERAHIIICACRTQDKLPFCLLILLQIQDIPTV